MTITKGRSYALQVVDVPPIFDHDRITLVPSPDFPAETEGLIKNNTGGVTRLTIFDNLLPRTADQGAEFINQVSPLFINRAYVHYQFRRITGPDRSPMQSLIGPLTGISIDLNRNNLAAVYVDIGSRDSSGFDDASVRWDFVVLLPSPGRIDSDGVQQPEPAGYTPPELTVMQEGRIKVSDQIFNPGRAGGLFSVNEGASFFNAFISPRPNEEEIRGIVDNLTLPTDQAALYRLEGNLYRLGRTEQEVPGRYAARLTRNLL